VKNSQKIRVAPTIEAKVTNRLFNGVNLLDSLKIIKANIV